MRSLALLSALLLGLVVAPTAQAGLTDLENAIGLYTAVPRDLDNVSDLTSYEGSPGTFPVYVVITQPYNENTGGAISRLGGFEFRVELPSNVFLLGAELPPLSANFKSPPEFLVGTNIPVSGDAATLVTLTLGEFTGTFGRVLLAPVDTPSIAGSLAVADYNDEFSLSAAVPSSGSLDKPVFCFYCLQNAEQRTWGGVKSLYH